MPEAIIKRWDTQADEKVCPICLPLEGQTRKLTESFTLPSGFTLGGPPAHPGRRCKIRHFSESTLTPRKDLQGQENSEQPTHTEPVHRKFIR